METKIEIQLCQGQNTCTGNQTDTGGGPGRTSSGRCWTQQHTNVAKVIHQSSGSCDFICIHNCLLHRRFYEQYKVRTLIMVLNM